MGKINKDMGGGGGGGGGNNTMFFPSKDRHLCT